MTNPPQKPSLYVTTQPTHPPQFYTHSTPSQQPHHYHAPPNRPLSPGSLPPPPHSPISPRAVAAQLSNMEPFSAPRVMAKVPEAVPIAESDNPDVVALRSALMILQVQREAAKRDIKELQKLRDQATADPEAYVKELVRRRDESKGKPSSGEDLLAPTLRHLVEGLGEDADLLKVETEERDDRMKKPKKEAVDEDISSDEEEAKASKSRFSKTPQAQNIYRMPPINWAKYQLTGAGLEKLHEDQNMRPALGQPLLPGQAPEVRPDPYLMAGTYQGVVDAAKFGSSEHPMQTRRGSRKF